jgi:hypothetical protein
MGHDLAWDDRRSKGGGDSCRWSPNCLNWVLDDEMIDRQNRHIFNLGLGDQNPIKRIFVNFGKIGNLQNAGKLDR